MAYLAASTAVASVFFTVYLTTLGLLGTVGEVSRGLRLEARLVNGGQSRILAIVLRMAINRLSKSRPGKFLTGRLKAAGISAPRETAFWLIAAIAAVVVIVALSSRSILIVLLIVFSCATGLNAWLKKRAADRLERFSEQLPSIFRSAGAAIKAGSSIQQALIHASEQIGEPAKTELVAVNEQIALGMPVDRALDDLHKRLPATELNFILMGLSIQRRIGGNLVGLLNETTQAIENRRRLQRTLTIETAQARLSARIIGFLPLLVTCMIALIDPSFIAPLFATAAGLIMLSVAVMAEVAGFVLLRRILDVKI